MKLTLHFPIVLTYSIAKPYLEELSGGHTVVGEKLTLKCTLKVTVRSSMEWVTPDRNGIRSGRISVSKSIADSNEKYHQILTIEKTKPIDQGEYTCIVKDPNHVNNNTRYVRIFDKAEHFINLTEENGVYEISVSAGEPSIQWSINVEAHPSPKLVWLDNHNTEIQAGWADNGNNKKYEVRTENHEAFLKIFDITIFDRGTYQLKAINDYEEKTLNLFLNVTDKPTVHIETDSFHVINQQSIIKCKVAAYPDPSIYWYYRNCLDNSCQFEPRKATGTDTQGLLKTSFLNLTSDQSGFVMCTANNSMGSDRSIMGHFLTDVDNGFGIWGFDEETKEIHNEIPLYPIARGETITMYCAASRYNYTEQLKWYKNNGSHFNPIEENDHFKIEKSSTEFSNKLTLTIHQIGFDDSGNYTCQVKEKFITDSPKTQDMYHYDNITLSIKDPSSPLITDTNLNGSTFTIALPDEFRLWCFAVGIPKPTITWYLNGEEIVERNTKSRITFFQNDHVLQIPFTQVEDEGEYTCRAKNKIGVAEKRISLQFNNKPTANLIFVYVIVGIIFSCLVVCIYTCLRYRKEKVCQLAMRAESECIVFLETKKGVEESCNSPNVKYAALTFSHSDNNPLPRDMVDYRGNCNYSGNTAVTDTTMVSMTPTGGEDCLMTGSNNSVRQHYVDLNDPYLVMNTQRIEAGHSDYLAMLSPPDFEHLSSPHHYVNDDVHLNGNIPGMDTPGYLCMKPSSIFSPREQCDTVFNFDVDNSNRKHKNSDTELALGTELLPMLHTQNESDCELSPCVKTPTSFSNPSYHMPPIIMEKTDEDIVKTADNYVNMPQNKNAMKNEKNLKECISATNEKDANHYVNNNTRDWERVQV
ncbi:hypothetical protein PPYR_07871 [Photinus pyralis]|uniref:Ig-like domain-containing protein n=1 Tax=Photinus pyralis TaxID=7054 RepID=A0A5N4ARN7_PHOPY|nr:hypothetical protein PPYR_07871 [Photinus pyralis]